MGDDDHDFKEMHALLAKLGMEIGPGATRQDAGEMMAEIQRRMQAGDSEVIEAVAEMQANQEAAKGGPRKMVMALNQDCRHCWVVAYEKTPQQAEMFLVSVTTQAGASALEQCRQGKRRHVLSVNGTKWGPAAEGVVDAIRRACLYPLDGSGEPLRPGSVYLSHRLSDQYRDIEGGLADYGINCMLESKAQAAAEQAGAGAAKEKGGKHFAAKQYALALDQYLRSAALSPSSVVHSNVVLCLLKLDDEATRAACKPGELALGEGERLPLALEHAQAAVRLLPRSVKAHYREGQVHEAMGAPKRAAECYADADALQPNTPEIVAAIGRVGKPEIAQGELFPRHEELSKASE